MSEPPMVPLEGHEEYPVEEMLERARSCHRRLDRRRTVRDFDDRPVPREIIDWCIRAAGTAPSGANLQPWHFVAVGRDPDLRRRLREAAEAEEREFYRRRAPEEWLEALGPLGTDSDKPFLETAPWLVAVFVERFGLRPDGARVKHYYAVESVGLATGMLIGCLHEAGLATLTHTPSPMGFLNELLERPGNESAYLLLVVGYPAPGCRVPDIDRKPLEEIRTVVGERAEFS